jgi:hypothetical protein
LLYNGQLNLPGRDHAQMPAGQRDYFMRPLPTLGARTESPNLRGKGLLGDRHYVVQIRSIGNALAVTGGGWVTWADLTVAATTDRGAVAGKDEKSEHRE